MNRKIISLILIICLLLQNIMALQVTSIFAKSGEIRDENTLEVFTKISNYMKEEVFTEKGNNREIEINGFYITINKDNLFNIAIKEKNPNDALKPLSFSLFKNLEIKDMVETIQLIWQYHQDSASTSDSDPATKALFDKYCSDENLYAVSQILTNNPHLFSDQELLSKIATRNISPEIKKLLLTFIKDLNIKGGLFSKGLLHILTERGDIESIQFLIAKGADLNLTDSEDQTALHLAAEKNKFEVAKLLLDAGANCNPQNNDGEQTPLHLAAFNQNRSIIKLLLIYGADTTIENNFGKTANQQIPNGNWEEEIEIIETENALQTAWIIQRSFSDSDNNLKKILNKNLKNVYRQTVWEYLIQNQRTDLIIEILNDPNYYVNDKTLNLLIDNITPLSLARINTLNNNKRFAFLSRSNPVPNHNLFKLLLEKKIGTKLYENISSQLNLDAFPLDFLKLSNIISDRTNLFLDEDLYIMQIKNIFSAA